jgi:hypothetical protein
LVAKANLWVVALVAGQAVPAAIKAAQITRWVPVGLPITTILALITALVVIMDLKLA